jgi:hypothetical protein
MGSVENCLGTTVTNQATVTTETVMTQVRTARPMSERAAPVARLRLDGNRTR